MAEDRQPAFRKRATKQELAELHPVERLAYRTFEFLSSLKLAVILMAWLIIECILGTWFESTWHAGVSKYFVYASPRFFTLLCLLGLNILCAALIRFPWRRYQTGFVVTHLGMLVLLYGCLVSWMGKVDALMTVTKGESSTEIFDSHRSLLHVTYLDDKGNQQTQRVAANFGPFTWGSRPFANALSVFGDAGKNIAKTIGLNFVWGEDRVDELPLQNGMKLRVKKYFANTEPSKTFEPSDDRGVPAVRYRIDLGSELGDSAWLAPPADAEPPMDEMASESLMFGTVHAWKLANDAEFEHFTYGFPYSVGQTLPEQGILAYTFDGILHFTHVSKLIEVKQWVVEGAGKTIRLVNHFERPQLNPERGEWVEGDQPSRFGPLLQIRVEGEDVDHFLFAYHHELTGALRAREGNASKHYFTYYRPDLPADPQQRFFMGVVEMAMTPNGRLGYRCFARNGSLIEAKEITKDYEECKIFSPPMFPMSFTVERWMYNARPTVLLDPRPILETPEKNQPGVTIDVVSADGKDSETVNLVQQASPNFVRVGDQFVSLRYDIVRQQAPLKVQLDDFIEPKNPGTQQAAAFDSIVTLYDKDGQRVGTDKVRATVANDSPGKAQFRIHMNHPLRYEVDGKEYALYQSGITRIGGKEISTYSVSVDPGLNIIYTGAIIMVTGIFLMFYMGGYFKKVKIDG